MRMKQLLSVLGLCVLVVSGCANRGSLEVKKAGESIGIYHEGKRIKQRHVVESGWGVPGEVSYITCRPEQLAHDAFWGIPTCPDTIEHNAPLSVEAGRTHIAGYRDVVLPAAIHGLAFIAGMGTLGAVMPGTSVNQTANPYAGSAISTMYVNGQVPAWLVKP